MCRVAGEISRPKVDRPNEGFLSFHVDYSSLASYLFDSNANYGNEQSTDTCVLIERVVRGSRAIDTESLCIVPGQKVWSVRVDVRALNDDGNLRDASLLAAIAGLTHYRREEVSFIGGDVQVHPLSHRQPIPLSMHHLPLLVSISYVGSPDVWLVDPSKAEEGVQTGILSVAANQFGDICGIYKPGGIPLSLDEIENGILIATARAKDLIDRLRTTLEEDTLKRKP